MQAIGTNLRRLRVRAGLTQDALAGMLHVTRQTVSSWEIGRTEPDLDTLLALAEALHCDATELIYGVKRNGYRQYQLRWIVCSMVCGAVLLALLVLQLVLVPALEARQGMTYSLAYSIYRLCVPQLPEWKMMRLPPSARHTAALCSRYWMLFSRLSSSRLDILI